MPRFEFRADAGEVPSVQRRSSSTPPSTFEFRADAGEVCG